MVARRTLLRVLAGIAGSLAMPVFAAPPSTVEGFSTARLARIDGYLTQATAPGGYLGAVALVARHGKVVYFKAFGHADIARRTPMRTDAIFRIYSMTKTIATVAVLMLMEEGKLALDEPVSMFLPAFADVQVYTGGTPDAPQPRAPTRPLTIRHLLTHTAGFATVPGEPATTLLERADLHGARDLADFAQRASRVPLAADPGTRFRYDGTQIEIASRIVEVVSGQSFGQFLHERIFAPLGMRDTAFEVDGKARERVPDLTTTNADGTLALADTASAKTPGVRLNAYDSGAGGLYSTAQDYLRFARMLEAGGTLDGTTVLGRKTVELMMHNQLAQEVQVTGLFDGEGFGLGGSVLIDVGRRGRLGSQGQFGWSGAASTYYTVDREEGVVAMLFLQHLPGSGAHELPRLQHRYYNLVYQALQ